MNTNIDLSNIKTHFFLDDEKYEKNHDDDKNNKTKITIYDFYSINEANISDIIKNMNYYSNNYYVVNDYDYINISQLSEKYIDKLNLSNNQKYLIFKYKNENNVHFNDFLFNITNPKIFIFNVIETFSYILKSLIELNNNNICFFNLSPQNICFNLDCGEKPILQNFQLSLQISCLNNSYITNIINKLEDYTYKPIEIHVLFYLIKNEIKYIKFFLRKI
jgi:hypothetical protein